MRPFILAFFIFPWSVFSQVPYTDLDGRTFLLESVMKDHNRTPHTFAGEFKNIASHVYDFCAKDDEGVRCWSMFTKKPLYQSVDFSRAHDYSMGANHLCIIQDNRVRCYYEKQFSTIWKNDLKKGEEIPPSHITNPKKIVSGSEHSCVLDEEGVKCWGNGNTKNGVSSIEVPNLVNPRDVSASADNTCALDDEGMKCWGFPTIPPVVSKDHITEMEVAGSTVCVIKNDSVTCWNNPHIDFDRVVEIKALANVKKPRNLKVGSGLVCVQDGADLACENLSPPSFMHKLEIKSMKNYDISKIHINGLRCLYRDGKFDCGGDEFVNIGYKYPFSIPKNSALTSESKHVKCALVDSENMCWNPLHKIAYKMPMDVVNPRLLKRSSNILCALDATGLRCWNISDGKSEPGGSPYDWNFFPKKLVFDQSDLFYQEKSLPLTYANELIINSSGDMLNFDVLLYFREILTEKFAVGMTSEILPTILSNTTAVKSLYKTFGLVENIGLSSRSSSHLSFVLKVIAKSLISSKYLLSTENKTIVDKLNVEFANVLTNEEVTLENAQDVMSLLKSEGKLLEDMDSSHRLKGIKAYVDWAYLYTTTGKVE